MKEEHNKNYRQTETKVTTTSNHDNKDSSSLQKPKPPKHNEEKINHIKKIWKIIRQTFHITYSTGKVLLITFLLLLTSALIFGAGCGVGYFANLVDKMTIPTEASLDKDLHQLSELSTLKYANGETIATLQSDIVRTTVNAKDIPNVLKEAVIDTEDPNFYHHKGVVPKAILRAMVAQMTGAYSPSGGSTITQQLVKQQLLSNEATFDRKAKEVLLAARIEKYFSKEDILTTYLNVTSFGRNNKGENIAGIDEAAKGIFGVSPKDLSLPQAAFIAGLPQSPIVYSPYNALGELKSKNELRYGLERKNIVLLNMYRQGDISKKEYEQAKNYDLTKDFLKKEEKHTRQYNYLYFAIKDEAIRRLMPLYYQQDGYTKEDIHQSEALYNQYYELAGTKLSSEGYTVTSTIDKNIYQTMQEVVKNEGSKLDEKKKDKTVEVGNVLLNNETGRVYGFVGGRDFNKNENNHALFTKRSAASTMKPIIAYAPALDIGLINSQTMLNNQYFVYSNGKQVTNYGNSRGSGFESATEALMYSHNIPVMNLYRELLKEGNPYQYISDLNLGLTEKQVNYESSPLGTNNVTVLAQTGAYSALANGGVFNEPYMVESIKDSQGNIVYEHELENKQVFKPSTASIMNEMMRKVLTEKDATGYRVTKTMKKEAKTLSQGDWVAKTGTSEYNTDFWFIASTPKVTLSSWTGYDDNSKMTDHVRDAGMDYWVKLADAIHKADPTILGLDQSFNLSNDVYKAKVSKATGTKTGTCKYKGKKYTTPNKTVEAYATESDAIKKASYTFGIGGTEGMYQQVWQQINKK